MSYVGKIFLLLATRSLEHDYQSKNGCCLLHLSVTPGKINRTLKTVSVMNTVMYTIPYKSPSLYGMWYWPVRCKPKGLNEASQMPWLL